LFFSDCKQRRQSKYFWWTKFKV